MPDPDHWDPSPEERAYYRHASTGDRGYLVRREGQDFIRYDLGPIRERVEPFNPSLWKSDHDRRPLTLFQAASVSWAADQMLSRFLGDYEARKDWQALSDRERAQWMGKAPEGRIRAKLYQAVMECLREESA